MRISLLALLAFACVAVIAPGTSHAAPSAEGSIGVRLLDAPLNRKDDPRAHRYIVDHLAPGTTVQRRVEISNNTSSPQHIELYAAAANIHNGSFEFATARTQNELTGWIAFDRPSIDVPANSAVPATVRIAVPPGASAGERYGVLWAEAFAPPGPAGNVGVVNRVGVRTYLDIGPGGEPPSDFQIAELTPARSPDGRPMVNAQVRNTGERALDVNGDLALSDGPGSLRAGPFPTSLGTTLAPGDTGTVSVVLDPQLPPGPWSAQLDLRSGFVHRSVKANLTFPETSVAGTSIDLGGTSTTTALLIAVLAAAAAALVILARRALPSRASRRDKW